MSIAVATTAQRLAQIQKVSRWMVWLTLAVIVGLGLLALIGLVLTWDNPQHFEAIAEEAFRFKQSAIRYSAFNWMVGSSLLIINILPLLYALGNILLLFNGFAHARLLTMEAATRLKHIGLAFIAMQPLAILTHTIAGVLLTMNNGEGQRMLAVGIEGQHILTLLFGGLLLVIGWVMGEAVEIAEDHKQIL